MISNKEYHEALKKLDDICKRTDLPIEEILSLQKGLIMEVSLYEDILFREYLDEEFLTYNKSGGLENDDSVC